MPQYQGVWNLQDAARLQSQQQWVTDPNFRNTTLLLQADNAAGGAQNNTFLDSSSNNFAITRNGNTTQGTFTPFSQGWSNYFNGSSDFFNIATPSSTFALGTGAFTIEAWVYVTKSAAFQGIFSTLPVGATAVGFGLYINTSDKLELAVGNGSTGTNIATAASIAFNTWVHVAATRVATTGAITVFINGVSSATGTSAANITSQDAIVGRIYTNSTGNHLQGYISNVRVSNVVRTISVPTAPYSSDANTLFLVSQSNRFVDNGANSLTLNIGSTTSVQPFAPFAPQFQYTQSGIGGSGYFDGTGDYLSIANNAALQFGSGNFTIEFWFYSRSFAAGQQFVNTDNGTNANNSYAIVMNTSGVVSYYLGTGAAAWNIANNVSIGTARVNSWNHVALVRNGSTITPYLNGVAGTTTTSSSALANFTSPLMIGIYNGTTEPLNGYLSSLRFVKGTAVYTGAFSSPIAPLSTSGSASASAYSSTTNVNTTFASSECSLLLNFTNAGIIDGTMDNVLETVGNAQVSTSVVKYGSGSLAFDGSSDSLKIGPTPLLNLGTGDFTIEFWCNPNTVGASRAILASGNTTFNAGAVIIAGGVSGNDSMRLGAFDFGGPSYTIVRDTAATPTGTWTHYAFVRSGNNFALYRNGTSVATATWTGSFNFNTNNLTKVGGDTWDGANSSWDGYIDDLRITRVARYLSNFTPPQVALPRQ